MRAILWVLLATLTLFSTGCPRKDPPPVLSIICLGDGFGGGDCSIPVGGSTPPGCVLKDATKPTELYCPPSALKNMWMTTQPDEASFAGWCYKVPAAIANAALNEIRARMMMAKRDESTPPPPAVVWEQGEVHGTDQD